MARYLTSSSLIESVLRRSMLPRNQITFTNDDFLAFANEEMDMAVMPYVLSFHEDYFLRTDSIALEQGKISYAIPYRAVGNKLRDVSYKATDGSSYEMTRVTIGDVSYYQYGGGSLLRSFYIKNNEVTLLTNDMSNPSGSLDMSYYLRPNTLVNETRIAYISAIDTNTGIVSLSTLPSIFTTSSLYDIIQIKSPHKCLAIDIAPISISTLNKTITFAVGDIPSGLVVGDYIALAEECIIPQIPTDLHSMLAQRIACRCLEALGDQAGLQAANAKLQEMETKGATIIDNRVEDAPQKINLRRGFLKRNKPF